MDDQSDLPHTHQVVRDLRNPQAAATTAIIASPKLRLRSSHSSERRHSFHSSPPTLGNQARAVSQGRIEISTPAK
jgi:hypothetical protein